MTEQDIMTIIRPILQDKKRNIVDVRIENEKLNEIVIQIEDFPKWMINYSSKILILQIL